MPDPAAEILILSPGGVAPNLVCVEQWGSDISTSYHKTMGAGEKQEPVSCFLFTGLSLWCPVNRPYLRSGDLIHE